MKLNKLFFGLTLVGLAGLSSCSSDESLTPDNNGKGEPVLLTVTVNRGKPVTRTELKENTGGGLDDKWLSDEVIQVFDASGNYVGTLLQQGDENQPSAVFSGEVNATEDNNYCLWYFGQPELNDKNEATNPYVNYENGIVEIDLSSQSFKSTEALSALDVMYKGVTLSVDKNNKQAVVTEDVTMTPVFAMVRFTLTKLDSEAVGSLTIKETTTDENTVGSIAKFYLKDGSSADTANGLEITVDNVSATNNDVYVALLPKAYTFEFVFTNTADNAVYKGQITSKELEAGKYYCVLPGQGETDLSGIKIEMTKENGSGEEGPYSEYAGEDPRNPLHKFAKYNLTRIGDEENDFAVAGDNGALYQWGRNHGFIDTKGCYENSSVFEVGSNDFINYLDAMGMPNFEENDNLWGTQGYYVYEQTGSGYIQSYYSKSLITSATGGYSGNLRYYETPWFINSLDHLKADKYAYVMHGVPIFTKIEGYGTGYAGVDEYTAESDYWVESVFKDGGSKWGERAKKGDYENANPCPDNWRLPTLAEMKAISPENGLYEKNGDLSTMLSGYAEVRKTGDISYAIRWILKTSGIIIECVVIDDASITQSSQLNSYFWDSNASKKVVREFPYTGGIRPFVANSSGGALDDTYIARPMPMGKADIGFFQFSYGKMTIIGPNENPDYPINAFFGGYWVEEKGKAFVFCSKNYNRRVETASEYTRLRIEDAGPVMGYAIRPVMDVK